MGPRLSSWNMSSVDRHPKINIMAGARRSKEELPALIEDKETTYFSFSMSRRSSKLHAQNGSLAFREGRGTRP